MEKLVVFTGSFCPPTLAHFDLMSKVMEEINAKYGCFLPVADSHIYSKMMGKRERLMLKSDIRINMLDCYCKEHKNVFISDYEIIKNDSDHTYDTFMHIKSEHPDKEIYYLMGADKLKSFPKWRNIDGFLANFKFVVLDRADINAKTKIEKDPLLSRYKDNFEILPALDGLQDMSSTKIRDMFVHGDKTYRKYLHPGVSDLLEKINLDDYPEVDIYDFIAYKLKKGLSSETKACSTVYQMNKELFDKNEDLKIDKYDIHIIDDECDLSKIKNYPSTHYMCGDYPYFKLVRKFYPSAIICEASYERTAGMYDQGGHMTLEEELCRTTNLSQGIYQFGMSNLKCVRQSNINRTNLYPLKNNILIDNVKFIREGKDNAYRLLNVFTDTTTVILVPCLNIRCYPNEKDRLDYDQYSIDGHLTKEGIEIIKDRLRSALNAALMNNIKVIIINAFGREKFRIPYSDIVEIYNDVFEEFDRCFHTVIINLKRTGFAGKQFVPYFKLLKEH